MSYKNSRRDAIKQMSLTGIALATSSSWMEIGAAPENATWRGNINHSVCQWCVSFIPLEEMAAWIRSIGVGAIDLLSPKEWNVLKKYNLHCSMCYTDGKISLTEGWNRKEHHSWLVDDFTKAIPMVKEAGFTNLICFSGNRKGMDDETGMNNCVEGLKKIMSLAERNGVTIQMELLNSKIDHKDYMADKSAWGVELCKRIGSPNFKLLYDIYHMQIDEGDVIRTIRDYHEYFGHYHTAGVPGRQDLDESQELFYPAIMKAIHETGFKGYVAQEFMAKGESKEVKLKAIENGIKVCDI